MNRLRVSTPDVHQLIVVWTSSKVAHKDGPCFVKLSMGNNMFHGLIFGRERLDVINRGISHPTKVTIFFFGRVSVRVKLALGRSNTISTWGNNNAWLRQRRESRLLGILWARRSSCPWGHHGHPQQSMAISGLPAMFCFFSPWDLWYPWGGHHLGPSLHQASSSSSSDAKKSKRVGLVSCGVSRLGFKKSYETRQRWMVAVLKSSFWCFVWFFHVVS